jgi:hypothetical protein
MLSNKTSFLVPCCEVSYDFRVNTSLLPFVLDGVLFYLCCLYLFTYTVQSNTISIYHVIVATLNSNRGHYSNKNCLSFRSTWVYTLGFSEVRIAQSQVFYVVFCRSFSVFPFPFSHWILRFLLSSNICCWKC